MPVTRVCRKHKTVKANGYCLVCKRETEAARYERNPEAERIRKRNDYYTKKSNGEQMAKPKVCDHDGAIALEDDDVHESQRGQYETVYNCPECGEFFVVDEDSGEPRIIPDPTEPKAGASQAGKAQRPHAVDAQRAVRPQQRDPDKMVEVRCSWRKGTKDHCKTVFRLYPQNRRPENYCPTKHRPLMRAQQNRDRVSKHRALHGRKS